MTNQTKTPLPPGADVGRRVVCAAVVLINGNGNDVMFTGARHFDGAMLRIIRLNPAIEQAFEDGISRNKQGFIDQRGVFMTRTEAWKVAQAAGQILRRCGGDDANGGTLYSENLY
uniref:Uncharacterized protein n=1 Tax=Candidatus Nitrotoga fabula TaxID=2182327 RepID=A0A2X0REN1_9PROT|nr:conserved protein of unknown function [Candidatus Nitrotoga fabula]